METIKIGIVLFVIGLKDVTLTLLKNVWESLKAIWAHFVGLVAHTVSIPINVVAWIRDVLLAGPRAFVIAAWGKIKK